ncbi:MAG: ABC1 kinase family protein [Pseudomonadota bacterium]
MDSERLARRHLPLRDLGRLAHILRVAAEMGWRHYLERMHLQAHLPGEKAAATAATSEAERLRRTLEALGPAFVKFGQMLSVRQDLFPDEVIQELQKLQDAVPPFPAATTHQLIQETLGQPASQLFARFDDAPLAAASMAQVHGAVLDDGTAVVVKVQRPDIEQVIRTDLEILFFIARLAQRHLPEIRRYEPVTLVEDFADTITRELDFRREGHNAERFRELFAQEPAIYIPQVFWHLSSQRVLTMERSPGCKIGPDCPPAPESRQRLADTLVRLYLVQIFEQGFFHGDPHPGNLFVLADGRLCFHDFGIVGRLSAGDQAQLGQLLLSLVARDPAWMADTYLAMGGGAPGVDRAAFTRDLSESLEQYYAVAAREASFAEILNQFIRLGRRHRIRVLPQYLLAFKAFVTVESVARSLDPRFNMLAAFQAYVPQLLGRQWLPGMPQANDLLGGYRFLSTLRGTLSGGPDAFLRGLRQWEQGDLALRLRHEQLDEVQQHIDRAGNRLSLSLIIAALLIGSSLVMAFHSGPHYRGIPLLGLVGYLLASALGLWWAVAILRSGKF